MFNRKDIKSKAKTSLKKHYKIFVFVCFFAAFIGAEYSGSVSIFSAFSPSSTIESIENGDIARINTSPIFIDILKLTNIINNNTNVFEKIKNGDYDKSVLTADEYAKENEQKAVNIGHIEIAHSAGVFANVINSIMSGKYMVVTYNGIRSIIGSDSGAVTVMIIGGLLIALLFWIFVVNVYKVILRRIMLEGRIYEKIPANRFSFLFKIKKWCKAALTMFIYAIYQLLWFFTIVGGIIKIFSYFAVPYIIAENPDISPNKAITLSRKMMNGHKWECFIIVLSFLPWDILNLFTFGLLNIFFVNPYKQATFANYFVYLRSLAKENEIENIDLLNDRFLYKVPSKNAINVAYKDISALKAVARKVPKKSTGIRAFFENVFGIVLSYDKHEIEYQENIEAQIKVRHYENVLDGLAYPTRLSPIPERKKRKSLETMHYMRHYSLSSLILIFFIMCVVGWIYEVILNLIQNGFLANRGFFHGPWLPIYGSGGVLILAVLYRFRKKPVLEFFTTVLLCGVVEYLTSFVMEIINNQRWWDYKGFFMNINGRVCAEGLLVFGVAGIAAVYFAAPLLDNLIRRVPKKAITIICFALIAIFAVDFVYSVIHPNTGEGVTATQPLERVKSVLTEDFQ